MKRGVTNFDIHDLKEESAVEVLGTVKTEERAPHGFEDPLRRDQSIITATRNRCRSPISKWKMNTSLRNQAGPKRPVLRNVRENALNLKFRRHQEASEISFIYPGVYRSHTQKIVARGSRRPDLTYLN